MFLFLKANFPKNELLNHSSQNQQNVFNYNNNSSNMKNSNNTNNNFDYNMDNSFNSYQMFQNIPQNSNLRAQPLKEEKIKLESYLNQSESFQQQLNQQNQQQLQQQQQQQQLFYLNANSASNQNDKIKYEANSSNQYNQKMGISSSNLNHSMNSQMDSNLKGDVTNGDSNSNDWILDMFDNEKNVNDANMLSFNSNNNTGGK